MWWEWDVVGEWEVVGEWGTTWVEVGWEEIWVIVAWEEEGWEEEGWEEEGWEVAWEEEIWEEETWEPGWEEGGALVWRPWASLQVSASLHPSPDSSFVTCFLIFDTLASCPCHLIHLSPAI